MKAILSRCPKRELEERASGRFSCTQIEAAEPAPIGLRSCFCARSRRGARTILLLASRERLKHGRSPNRKRNASRALFTPKHFAPYVHVHLDMVWKRYLSRQD